VTRFASAGAKVVEKAYPGERVGVFAQQGNAVMVVEYRRAGRPSLLLTVA
jgi:UDP-N-acetylglucosamine pyrophosphorylase